MAERVYLDAASVAPPAPEALTAMADAMAVVGDPLSIHAPGRAAKALLDDSRDRVAEAIGAQADEIVFTSGGTESVTLALTGHARANRPHGGRILVSAVEHPAVAGAGDGVAEAPNPRRASGLPLREK